LRYRKLVLHEQTGQWRYQPKLHERIVPSDPVLKLTGRLLGSEMENTFVLNENTKKRKLNTPIKAKDVRRCLSFSVDDTSNSNTQLDSEGRMNPGSEGETNRDGEGRTTRHSEGRTQTDNEEHTTPVDSEEITQLEGELGTGLE
jgi:hypothetical protein